MYQGLITERLFIIIDMADGITKVTSYSLEAWRRGEELTRSASFDLQWNLIASNESILVCANSEGLYRMELFDEKGELRDDIVPVMICSAQVYDSDKLSHLYVTEDKIVAVGAGTVLMQRVYFFDYSQ